MGCGMSVMTKENEIPISTPILKPKIIQEDKDDIRLPPSLCDHIPCGYGYY